jgi:hypothetical protein
MQNDSLSQQNDKKTLSRLMKISLLIISLLSIFVLGRSHFPHGLGADQIKEFPSPDAKYKAVLLTNFGGGMGGGYCYDEIYVISSDSKMVTESQKVYQAGCHSLSTNNGPEVNWLANNRLQIHFSANQGARGIDQLILKGFAASGQIYMTYVVSENSL